MQFEWLENFNNRILQKESLLFSVDIYAIKFSY